MTFASVSDQLHLFASSNTIFSFMISDQHGGMVKSSLLIGSQLLRLVMPAVRCDASVSTIAKRPKVGLWQAGDHCDATF